MGAMEDVPQVRPADIGAHTFLHIAENTPGLKLPTLERLGLMNAAGFETAWMHKSDTALYGRAMLVHSGADTFMGHQEIMGTYPDKVFAEPFKLRIEETKALLEQHGHTVEYYEYEGERLLIVDGAVTVADNIECDPGQAVNVEAAIDEIDFDKALEIGRLVRTVTKVPRVIVFGGSDVTLDDMLGAIEHPRADYLGVNAPKSGCYNKNYNCIHMGFGVDAAVQAQTILAQQGVPVFLLGKVADVVDNPHGTSISMVETRAVLARTIEIVKETPHGFICTNVQETDLCGHRENIEAYADRLRAADEMIAQLLPLLTPDDVLVVTADHGNDPCIGHPHHTREYVPLLLHKQGAKSGCIGVRKTLSDTGATACDFFHAPAPENGQSYLHFLV